jgi:exodeoxyribonuclease VII small subunit
MADKAAKTIAVETLTFESALDELQAIVKSLETGQTALEDSIAAYERGMALRKHCEKKLGEARSKIEKISVNKDGTVSAAPFGEQE